LFQQTRILELMAEDLNKDIALPFDVKLAAKKCGFANAFYDKHEHQVTIAMSWCA